MNQKRHEIKTNFLTVVRDFFLKDIKVKLVCLFFAIVTYVFVAYSELAEKTFIKKLEITGLKSDLIISTDIPENVKMVIKDKKRVIDKLSEDDFYVKLDLSGVEASKEEGTNVKLQYNIPKTMDSFFSNITVIPDSVMVELETIKEKNVPIVVPTAGSVRSGYLIKEKKVTPYEVRIQGPESIIDSIKRIETERVDITDEYESFERHVKINNKNPKVTVMGTQTDNIIVYFVIVKKMDTKTVKIDKIYLDNLDRQFVGTVTNLPVVLTLTGTEAAIASLKPEDVVLSIDCANIFVPGNYSYKTIDMVLPSSITLSSMYPKVIDLKVIRRTPSSAEPTSDAVKPHS